MKIITGSARGTPIETLSGDGTRPTSARAKQGLFSAIQFRIYGRRVLDLFSGSGQLALEALSRGAEFAVLVDSERDAIDIGKKNAIKAKLMKQTRMVCTDYEDFILSCKEKFGLVFIDPPYGAGKVDNVLKLLLERDLLEDGGIVVCESGDEGIPSMEGFAKGKSYRYGKTTITILEYEKDYRS